MLVVCSFAILIVRLKTLGRDIIRNNKCTFQPYSIPDCPVCGDISPLSATFGIEPFTDINISVGKGKSSLSVALVIPEFTNKKIPVGKGKSSLSVALAASSANYSSNQAYTTHSRALAGAIFHSCSTTSGTTLIPVLNFSGSTVPLGNASST